MTSDRSVRAAALAACAALACAGAPPPSEPSAERRAPCLEARKHCRGELSIGGKQLPYYSSVPLDRPDPTIERAVIVVHGTGRAIHHYYDTMAQAANARGALGSTIVIAPFFQTDPSHECSHKESHAQRDELWWSCGGWKYGEGAGNAPDVTSYRAIDEILAQLARSFPHLARVTIAGHSAGGMVVGRYAQLNRVAERGYAAKLRYVVANASSYLYLDDRRLVAGTRCHDLATCALTAASFERPRDIAACPEFDRYPYGYEHPKGYAAGAAIDDVRRAYPTRDVTYLLGDDDSADTEAAHADERDDACPALLEGPTDDSFRRQRGLVFARYIETVFAGRHRVAIVPGCPHDQHCMFSSQVAGDVLFAP
jgi:pimeloyl-ACP methyl ester carboxylesterase